jgi:hypothetical protein
MKRFSWRTDYWQPLFHVYGMGAASLLFSAVLTTVIFGWTTVSTVFQPFCSPTTEQLPFMRFTFFTCFAIPFIATTIRTVFMKRRKHDNLVA